MSDSAESDGEDDRHSEGESDQRQDPSTVEIAVMILSVAVTVLLFAYAGWQIATPAKAEAPQATVVETAPLENGSVAVRVELRNPTEVGLITATVESNCTSPPAQVAFSYVPASSTRTGTLVCPPGTTNPSVSLANWVSVYERPNATG